MRSASRMTAAGPESPAEKFLTSNEVATIARCTPATIREWRTAGRLRATRVGGRWLFREGDVFALIAGPSDEELT